jgi:DNA-binding CsgD family transcriptional regulator
VATIVNDAHLFSVKRMIELSRLNEAERRVLRLLAEGHTVKSIASEFGTTPAAVNERLREARRKTGAGSSRELARLLRSQENRHEQLGVGRAQSFEAPLSQADAQSWRPQTGAFAMIVLFVIAAAGAAALMTQAPQALTNEVDPLIGLPLQRGPEPAELHARIRAEPRDPQWADRTERQIEERLMSVPLVGKDGNALRVTCASTLCEIAGTLIAPPSKEEQEDQNSQYSRTVKDLQVPPLTDDLAHLGLKVEIALFTGGKGKPDRLAFLLYYSRAYAKAK